MAVDPKVQAELDKMRGGLSRRLLAAAEFLDRAAAHLDGPASGVPAIDDATSQAAAACRKQADGCRQLHSALPK